MDTEERTPESRGPADAFWRFTLIFGLGALIAVTSFAAGLLVERDLLDAPASESGNASASTDGSFDRFEQVKDLVDEEYFGNPVDPTAQAEFQTAMEYGAIQGMMEALDDYSTFLVPAEQSELQEQLSGEYQGIGVWVDFPEGRLTIVSPIPGSPAKEAGLQAGDVIVAADGHVLLNTTEEDALTFVRGPEGTKVRLTIQRPGVAEPFDVEVERRRIPLQSVVYRMVPGQSVAFIQVTVFGDRTTEELDAALTQARDDGATAIVLDLRNNGGGWVQSAQEMIGRFIPADSGPALYEYFEADGSEQTAEPIIAGDVKVFDLPIVVLVNEGTASAAEIVAGALRDYGRATILGERTFGKGSVQRVHDFDDGSSVRITFAEWLTPEKQRIQGEGIQPDVIVSAETSAGITGIEDDPQVVAAVNVLLGLPVALPVASPAASPVA